MGKSKSNTGIGVIDQSVDAVVNQGTNRVGEGIRSIDSAIKKGVDPLKNLESAGQRLLQGIGEMSRGNFNNAGNTLLEIGANGLTFGGAGALGYKAGETATERRTRETVEKVAGEDAAKAAADAQAAADKKQNDINTIVSEMVNSRKRQPGRAATILTTVGAGSEYGPLLTGRQ